MGPLLFQEERRQGSSWLADLVCDESHFKCPAGKDTVAVIKEEPSQRARDMLWASPAWTDSCLCLNTTVPPPLSRGRRRKLTRDPHNLKKALVLSLHSLGVEHLG